MDGRCRIRIRTCKKKGGGGLGFTVIYSVVNTKVVHTCRRDIHVLLEASTELKFIVTITEIYANNTQKEEK